MNPSVRHSIESVRRGVGYWAAPHFGLLRVTGPDRHSWLQTQTTNDVYALQPGEGQASALLDRKGRIQGIFTVHRTDDELWLLTASPRVSHLYDLLNSHIFIEDVALHNGGEEVEGIHVHGPRSRALLASLSDLPILSVAERLPCAEHAFRPLTLAGIESMVVQHSWTGDDGFALLVEHGKRGGLLHALAEKAPGFDGCELDAAAQEVLRIESGQPSHGLDIERNTLLPETPLLHDAVSTTKGCYLGQEVVARLRAYGSVRMMLMGLRFPSETPLPSRNALMIESNQRIGIIKSGAYSPSLDANVALAYLDRDHRTPGRVIRFDVREAGREIEAEVMALPLVQPRTRAERAHARYDDAMHRFERDLHDEDDTAISLLEEAILLAPAFEDAYEALGVILNRHHRVDEAIHAMETLSRLNPKSVMAHTNLSVFFMKKGNLDKAEEEKAIANLLESQHVVDARQAQAAADAERRRIEHEARERIGMFREVLDIDPDDPLATFGMGSAHLQLQEYAQAAPYLERATQIQKDYSTAYLSLGKCHEFLGEADLAKGAYERGIAVASRRGDLMPLREMERRLKALDRPDSERAATKSP